MDDPADLPSGRMGRRDQRREVTLRLLREASAAEPGEALALQNRAVALNLHVARSVAAQYRNRGTALDDLNQVAYLGLVKSARRFDVRQESDFLSYAVPTIRGEVRRHFRDHAWLVRPPRRIQELQATIEQARGDLGQSLGRSPRPSEIAAHLGLDAALVSDAIAARGSFQAASLDHPISDAGTVRLVDRLVAEVETLDAVEARVTLAPLLRGLGRRDRLIVELRFFRGWSQSQIGTEIGVTQMQVSRLLNRILADLRAGLGDLGLTREAAC
jgi:RNA polymerase sigma-B factor